jgi:hypothetical protein
MRSTLIFSSVVVSVLVGLSALAGQLGQLRRRYIGQNWNARTIDPTGRDRREGAGA